jgi:hypothetical protein
MQASTVSLPYLEHFTPGKAMTVDIVKNAVVSPPLKSVLWILEEAREEVF